MSNNIKDSLKQKFDKEQARHKEERPRKKIESFYDLVYLEVIDNTGDGQLVYGEGTRGLPLNRCKVIYAGPGKMNSMTSDYLKMQVEVGDVVLVDTFAGKRWRPDHKFTYFYIDKNGNEVEVDSRNEYIVQREDLLFGREISKED